MPSKIDEKLIERIEIVVPRICSEWKYFTKEALAQALGVEESLVQQALHVLNIRGKVTKPVHDTNWPWRRDVNQKRSFNWKRDTYMWLS